MRWAILKNSLAKLTKLLPEGGKIAHARFFHPLGVDNPLMWGIPYFGGRLEQKSFHVERFSFSWKVMEDAILGTRVV